MAELHPARFTITLGAHSFDNIGALLPTFVPGQTFDRLNRSRVWKLEEKKTDVNIAMAMHRDVTKQRFDQIVLCSNDSDAEPALEAIREDYPDVIIGVVTPLAPPLHWQDAHRSISTSLAKHAQWTRRYILDEEPARAQLPAQVPTRKKPIKKPAHW